ncbi:A disintegrin and metalloproteinase with thrombospondin motifs 17 [Sarcoptes scabiei]|uniref:A disintegrin and metalloproteinase with thrombospondin motifs 17 n=1 Tax=Sarcoptes scabiei TaxID=52283 RepID=A0A834R217_SARSC|nr:A disintegrin and metalloproteinase with thrombospondin motifs 17 [Sarcoptes scabiei]
MFQSELFLIALIELRFVSLFLDDQNFKQINVGIDVDDTLPEYHFGDIHIKLDLFYDQMLLLQFHNNTESLIRFIYSITNAVSLIYNNRPLGRLARFHFFINEIEPLDENILIGDSGDGEIYRQTFKYKYLNRFRSKNAATLAILLTGYNFRYKRNRTDTQGLANVGFIACNRPQDSFLIIEARSFRAAFIMAHEIGHTLNMQHDEDYSIVKFNCGSTYIMSSTTGPGKTQFSICSYNQLRSYLIRKDRKIIDCFAIIPFRFIIRFPNQIDADYKSISINEQCRMALGSTFHAKDMTFALISVCIKIGCTNGFIDIFIDPAIENTTCGIGQFCRNGQCI